MQNTLRAPHQTRMRVQKFTTSIKAPFHCRAQVPQRSVRLQAQVGAKQPAPAQPAMTFANQLEALKAYSVVVADTGETNLVKQYKPVDCTTNPSLVYKAVQLPEYQHLLKDALEQDALMQYERDPQRPYAGVADILAVNIGMDLLSIVPGRVSTEVDAHLSYDTEATVAKALRLVELYKARGVDHSRLYIKMAATWEGIQACARLQKMGIDTNMTLLFSFAQAAACADAGAALISPFVGRIMDYYKAKEGRDFAPHEDPGVLSVRAIYAYYKAHGYDTVVMAASFRNLGEIQELAGCDKITIAPSLLAELEANTTPLLRKLSPDMGGCDQPKLQGFTKEMFHELHDKDPMAVEKLAHGIESFAADQRKLEVQIGELAKAQGLA